MELSSCSSHSYVVALARLKLHERLQRSKFSTSEDIFQGERCFVAPSQCCPEPLSGDGDQAGVRGRGKWEEPTASEK